VFPEDFFAQLWRDYTTLAPSALKIHRQLEESGEQVKNDHVAFRTFNLHPVSLEDLEPFILSMGYARFEPYEFPEKMLRAWSYLPPTADLPRIFFSELVCEKLSPAVRNLIDGLTGQIEPGLIRSPEVFYSGILWDRISLADYETLLNESEYAAWVASIGLRANHFTVAVQELRRYNTLPSIIKFVQDMNITVSEQGGAIKGGPDECLEQASTMADRMPIDFADGKTKLIPTCYYEFARRYPQIDGTLYQGFVAASANKIFESTNSHPGVAK